MGSRNDARVIRTRAALHAALIDLVATERFETISAAAIASRAGIGYATFFRHYPDPHALLLDIATQLIDEAGAEIAPFALAGDDQAVAASLVRFVSTRRDLCTALLVGAGDAVRRAIIARATATARALEVHASPDLPAELVLVHAVGSTLTILAWWLEHGRQSDDIESILVTLVFGPIGRSVLAHDVPGRRAVPVDTSAA